MSRGDLTQAHAVLPLRRLMGQYGHDVAPEGSGKNSDLPCPFCQKNKASFRPGDEGAELFKCWNSDCLSDTHRDGGSWAPVAFLAWQLKLTWKEAFVAYMKEAGLFTETAPVRIMPGAGSRKFKPPVADPGSMPEAERVAAQAAELEDEERRKRAQSLVDEPSDDGDEPVTDDDEPPMEARAASAAAVAGLPAATGGGAVPPVEEEVEEVDYRWRDALEAFYGRLSLTEKDSEAIWKKRGLPREASLAYGLRSSSLENQRIIEELRATYPDTVLHKAGLLALDEKTSRYYPEPQFCGKGNSGKKGPKKQMLFEWGLDPVLIPYFDTDDRLITIRPHKGGVPDHPPRLYVARFRKGSRLRKEPELNRTALITEGEFKAMALHWATDGRLGASALPGISLAKNDVVRDDYEVWLAQTRVERVVVCFDNEEKGDPKFAASYKPDEHKRYDSIVWAAYLAILLQTKGYEALFAMLPETWRDTNGKADWDGAMARFIAEKTATDGLQGTDSEIWEKCAPVVRGLFLEVFEGAVPPKEAKSVCGLGEAAWKIVKSHVDRKFYEAKIPFGGTPEFELMQKLRRLAKKPGFAECSFELEGMADAFKEVLGGYYVLRPIRDEKKLEPIRKQIERARKDNDREMVWWLHLKIKGRPQWITNFRIVPEYRLRTVDGKTLILCELKNNLGESTGQIELPSDAIAAPNDWRKWIGNLSGSFVWFAGQNELDSLKIDLGHEMAFQNVQQVAAIGEDPGGSGIWFFEDGAVAPCGTIIHKDEDGAFWWDGIGYILLDTAKDRQEFRMVKPKIRPTEWLGFDEVGDFIPAQEKGQHPDALKVLFQNFATACEQTIGGLEGFLAIGAVLSYGMAGDLFRKNGNFPCLWVHGETKQGKTTLVSWLMEMWGFSNMSSGIGMGKSSTAVGIQIVLEQFSNLPIWLDEFRANELDDAKRSVVHSAFNREPSTKHATDGRMRKVRTSLIVSGESTSDDPATRSRYGHVQVSANRRKGDFFAAVQRFRKFLFHLGREVLTRRPEFVERMNARLEEWDGQAELKNEDARSRIVHGAGYAGFCAMSDLLGGAFAESKIEEFRKFLLVHSKASVEQGREQVNVQKFLQDVLTAVRLGVFGHTVAEIKRFFGVVGDECDYPPDATKEQGFWTSYRVYLEPNGIIAKMKEHLGKQREEMVLSRSDLRDQMSSKPWWHEMNSRKPKWRFEGGKLTAWVIDLDHCPELGYRPVDDEALAEARRAENGMALTHDKFIDPRKGEFYALVERLTGEVIVDR